MVQTVPREPRSASARNRPPSGSHRLARQLPALREELEREREFRGEQLAHLLAHDDAHRSLAGHGPRAGDTDAASALQEIRTVVTAGARRALADIELAVARIDNGQYGRCRDCGHEIPLAVLTAIPRTSACLACQQRSRGTCPEDQGSDGSGPGNRERPGSSREVHHAQRS